MTEKTAAVTGSRRGIGFAVAMALGKEGYRVLVSGTASEEASGEALACLRSAGVDASYLACDISKAGDRQAFFSYAENRWGRLDILVNNAGVAPKARLDLLLTTEESFDDVLNVNLRGTFFMCQLAANTMLSMKRRELPDYCPRIVNIASVSSYASSTNRGEYCISKAGISMTTQLFADRLAQEGIPVFEVRPGIIRTDMTAAVQEKYERMVEAGITPIRRLGLPEDVADCVLAAVSGKLDFATGQVLNADGGFHIRRL